MSRQMLLISLRKTVLIIAFYFNWSAAVSSQFLADLNLDLRFLFAFRPNKYLFGCFSNIFMYNFLQFDV